MKLQHIFFSIGLLFCLYQPLKAQNFATDKHAVWLGINSDMSFTFGNLYSKDGYSNTKVGISSSYFVAKNILVGAHVNALIPNKTHELQIGPHIGYALGREDMQHHPYIIAGLSYVKMEKDIEYTYWGTKYFTLKGIAYKAALGYAVSLHKHLALNIEVGYQYASVSTTNLPSNKYEISTSGFYGGLGFSVMLFK